MTLTIYGKHICYIPVTGMLFLLQRDKETIIKTTCWEPKPYIGKSESSYKSMTKRTPLV